MTPGQEDFDAWKQNRLKSLTAPSGWLTLIGLFWLKEDEITIGTNSGNDINIPYSASANFEKQAAS